MSRLRTIFAIGVFSMSGILPCRAEIDTRLLKSIRGSLSPKIINGDRTVHIRVAEVTDRSEHNVNRNYSKELLAAKKALGKSAAKAVAEYELLVRGPECLVRIESREVSNKKNSRAIGVIAMNPDYGFRLNKQRENFTLDELIDLNGELALDPGLTRMIRSSLATVSTQEVYDFGVLADYLLSDVGQIEKVEHQGELVRVEFKSLGQDNPRLPRFRDAYSVHDNRLNLAIVEFGCVWVARNGEDISSIHNTYSYQPTSSGNPIVKEMISSMRYADEPENSQSTFQRTIKIIREDVPEKEFRLSYYGLPEPQFGTNWFMYAVIGVSLMVVGVLLIRWKNARA
ncbi:MAG: hypothetical protein KF752_14935 [Pirellulaceae bacterium]|nr:hypothetical protein [Pirellulaceae bacterium]